MKKEVSNLTEPKKYIPKEHNRILSAVLVIGRYFKNSWKELKMVLWPNRKATWAMTIAVIIFTGMFLAIIVALDAVFTQLFNLIIK